MSDLETERLRLEQWAPRHGVLLARLAAQPEVMRHVGTGEPWTPEGSARRHERALAHWRHHGAIVDGAFTRLGAPSVVARVQPANLASLRIAAALGLTPDRDAIDRDGQTVRILRRHRAGGAPPVPGRHG
jgi:RimJ/RimL family protein N-acetyltransferase